MARPRSAVASPAKMQQAWLHAWEAWFGAQSVIAHRTWLMWAAAGRPLTPAEGTELTRMVQEKAEAALAALPAAARASGRLNALLLEAAQKEAAAVSAWALQLAACTSPVTLQRLMAELVQASNGRSSTAATALANAWTAGALAAWTPFGTRIRRNARRIAREQAADALSTGRRRRPAPRTRS